MSIGVAKYGVLIAALTAGGAPAALAAEPPAREPEDPGTFSGWFTALADRWRLPDSVQVHGFASQSFLYTTGNNFFGRSTNSGTLDFTEMGINGSWRPTTNLQTSMQVVYRRAGKTDDSDLRIDFGYLDYSFISDSENLLGMRFGRVFNPYGLYNDTRDMPFTRPSILLPQSIYFDINRNFALSGDGVQLYGEKRTEYGDFSLQFNGFYSRTDDPDLVNIISQGNRGHLDGRPSWMGRLMYDWNAGQVRLAVTAAENVAKYRPVGSGPNLEAGTFSFEPIVFSAQYNAESWTFTSEYALRPTSLRGFGPDQPDFDFTGESYYFQGAYRFTESLEAFLRYDVVFANRGDRSGKKFSEASGLPPYQVYAKDFSAGMRWDVTSWLMLRAEYHRVNGTYWTSDLENRDSSAKQWDLFAASLSVRF